MTEARKSFMSPEQYSRVESNIHGQEDLLNKELRIARREMIAVYQNMVEQGFRSPSFFGVRRRLAKLLAVEEVWEQRVKDPAECEALGIETTNAMHQRLLRELSDSISQYLSNHERKSGKSRHYLERIGLLERLEQHVNTLNSVQGAFGRLQKELNFAYSDSQGYEESMSDDTAVMSLEKHKKRAVVAYTDNDVFFEKEGRKYAKYQCMNGVLRGELSLEEFSKEQRAVLEDDIWIRLQQMEEL